MTNEMGKISSMRSSMTVFSSGQNCFPRPLAMLKFTSTSSLIWGRVSSADLYKKINFMPTTERIPKI